MRTVQLSLGQAKVGVRHTVVNAPASHSLPIPGAYPKKRRATVAWLRIGEGVEVEATSICAPNDPFSKAFGRRASANRLLHLLKPLGLTKEDRKAVFTAICPEYN